MSARSRTRRHLPQLDGLRGIAVLLVLAEHFIYNPWVHSWSPGSVGVRSFFVLSGFLITGILLDDREAFAPMEVARRFFRNRALRLLPAFAVAVALAAVLGLGGMRQDWPWHLSYLSNVQVFLTGRWSGAGHFWTLAVEQQFYLLWFPVVVLLPRRWLLPVVVALLVAAPVFRGLIVVGWSEFLDVLIPAQADALALGALLAMGLRAAQGRVALAALARPPVMWGALVLVFLLSVPIPGVEKPMMLVWVVRPVVVSVAAAAVIAAVLLRPGGVGLLALPVLVWLGQISYGLYLFHYFVPQALGLYLPFVAGLDTGAEKLLRIALWVAVSLGLAVASRVLVEDPLLRLKRRGGAVVPPVALQGR